jgi:hypothetical protein
MLKDFIGKQTTFNKSAEQKLGKIDILTFKVDSLALDVELLKLKVLPNDVKESNTFAATNAIQVKIDENVRMLAELHARWEREDEMARKIKVCTITTSNDVVPNASNPLTLIGVDKTRTPCVKKPKAAKTFSQKSAEIFRSVGDDSSIYFNDFDVDGCNISEFILFLQKLALSPNASSLNIAFTKPFLRTVGAIIDMKEGTIKSQFPLKKGMEHFPRRRKKLLFDSILRANYELDASSLDIT